MNKFGIKKFTKWLSSWVKIFKFMLLLFLLSCANEEKKENQHGSENQNQNEVQVQNQNKNLAVAGKKHNSARQASDKAFRKVRSNPITSAESINEQEVNESVVNESEVHEPEVHEPVVHEEGMNEEGMDEETVSKSEILAFFNNFTANNEVNSAIAKVQNSNKNSSQKNYQNKVHLKDHFREQSQVFLHNPFSLLQTTDFSTNEFSNNNSNLTIDTLTLVGIICAKNKNFAIVKDSRQMIHKIESGYVFSNNLARVGAIAPGGIEIFKYYGKGQVEEKIFLSF